MTAGRGVKPASLVHRAIDLVKGFNPATQTVDSYADDAVGGGNADSSDTVFLKQVRINDMYGKTRTRYVYEVRQNTRCVRRNTYGTSANIILK